jgi:hypothetical protein
MGHGTVAQLDNLTVGMTCVIKANQGKAWLNLEAGALAEQLKVMKQTSPGPALAC